MCRDRSNQVYDITYPLWLIAQIVDVVLQKLYRLLDVIVDDREVKEVAVSAFQKVRLLGEALQAAVELQHTQSDGGVKCQHTQSDGGVMNRAPSSYSQHAPTAPQQKFPRARTPNR